MYKRSSNNCFLVFIQTGTNPVKTLLHYQASIKKSCRTAKQATPWRGAAAAELHGVPMGKKGVVGGSPSLNSE